MWLSIYSILVFIYWGFLTSWLIINGRKIKYLSSVAAGGKEIPPGVLIVIAVKNEENTLREALTSVCNLSYHNYKVLVINDRSTDSSGKILNELQAKYNHLSVININTLPPGWLGKNHALYTGYRSSDEEYLLFTDADVLFNKDVLPRAMNYCLINNLEHLTILPGIVSKSGTLRSVILTFIFMLTALKRPWAAKIKTSKASMGVGAFNLVAREAYVRAGTHAAIAMRPDDDLQLAAHIKAAGGASDVLYGMEELQVEWYAGVKEFVNGLMKNAFCGFDYNIFKAAAGVAGVLLFFVLPLPVVLIFGNCLQRILVGCTFVCQAMLYGMMPGSKGKWWYACLSSYAGAVIAYVMAKAVVITLYNGGVYWRDTFYSLTELRKAK